MPRGLNVTHRELSLTEAVASDIWRPPALQAREDPLPTALAVLSASLAKTKVSAPRAGGYRAPMMEKRDQRRLAEAQRKTLVTPGHAAVLAGFAAALDLAPGAVVAGYCAFRDEADPRALMRTLAARGHRLALPAMVAKAAPLRFHVWCESDPLVVHPYGVREPRPECPVVVPDVLLVPMLAFDADGYRLGYGGGFYDRTLEALRATRPVLAIGIAYAGQQRTDVPRGEHDQRLDAVLTENGLTRFRS
jgi:5-formyltetrahydrofolate cyclo-ligase